MASVLASTLSTTSLAALSSFLSSRSTCSTIFPWASMPTYRDKEIDFKIAEKYYCWKQNKSSWKNQYLSSQEGEGGGLCRSVPAAHQTGRSSNLNVSGGSCDLPVQGLRVIWNFSSTLESGLLPPTWERLDCRHCIKYYFYICIFVYFCNSISIFLYFFLIYFYIFLGHRLRKETMIVTMIIMMMRIRMMTMMIYTLWWSVLTSLKVESRK